MVTPSPKGANSRDAKGRFAAGNGGGPGNPYTRRVANLRATLLHAVSDEVAERPVHYQEVFATLYHNLGIDIGHTTFTDLNGRPQYLLEHTKPVSELI